MWRLALASLVVMAGVACTPLKVHSGPEQFRLGIVHAIYLRHVPSPKTAPILSICFDYRINFDVDNFARRHRIAEARFVVADEGKDKGFWPTFGGIDIYARTPLFIDKNGWLVYYACGSPGYGPPSLASFMKERYTAGLSLADWIEVARRRPDTSLEGLEAHNYPVEGQIGYMKMIGQVLDEGKIKISPIFMRWGWFPRYIEFPELELVVNVDHLLSARGMNYKQDCTPYRIDLNECIPEWVVKEMQE